MKPRLLASLLLLAAPALARDCCEPVSCPLSPKTKDSVAASATRAGKAAAATALPAHHTYAAAALPPVRAEAAKTLPAPRPPAKSARPGYLFM